MTLVISGVHAVVETGTLLVILEEGERSQSSFQPTSIRGQLAETFQGNGL